MKITGTLPQALENILGTIAGNLSRGKATAIDLFEIEQLVALSKYGSDVALCLNIHLGTLGSNCRVAVADALRFIEQPRPAFYGELTANGATAYFTIGGGGAQFSALVDEEQLQRRIEILEEARRKQQQAEAARQDLVAFYQSLATRMEEIIQWAPMTEEQRQQVQTLMPADYLGSLSVSLTESNAPELLLRLAQGSRILGITFQDFVLNK
jgi:hypothetical protein